jgi:hypothetical protein
MTKARASTGATAKWQGLLATLAVSLAGPVPASPSAPEAVQIPIGPAPAKVGYALTDMRWAVHQSNDGAAECPRGLNEAGPTALFNELYPPSSTARALADTQLVREAAIWIPNGDDTSALPWREVTSIVSDGLNLDGRVDAEDFVSQQGQKGIDNQLYRVIGCVEEFRGPTGIFYHLANRFVRDFPFNRVLIELGEVDSLTDDPSVSVTFYRGLDRLLVDASGNEIIPGGTQRIDTRFAKRYVRTLRGKIEKGVLTTEPADITLPRSIYESTQGEEVLRDGRFQMTISETGAEGLLAGHSDVDRWYLQIMQSWSGQFLYPALHSTLRRLADAHPDSSGKHTAISSAMSVRFTRVFIVHPEQAGSSDSSSP